MKKQLLALTLLVSVVSPAIATDGACCGNPAEAIIPAAQEAVVAPEAPVAPAQPEAQPVEVAVTEEVAVQAPVSEVNPEEEEMTEEEIQKMIQKLLAEQGIQPDDAVTPEVAPEAQS